MIELTDRRNHWERIYEIRSPEEVSWYQPRPECSLELIRAAATAPNARILDVGGGTSRLIDCLLESGYQHSGVLDLSEKALEATRQRLGPASERVEWFQGDVTTFISPHTWDVWHDRAVFHFLIDSEDQDRYRQTLLQSLRPDGHAIIATFGPEGPSRCSGLPVQKYDAERLQQVLGPDLHLVASFLESHTTPSGTTQQFLYGLFRRS